jgi:hypothetical protein
MLLPQSCSVTSTLNGNIYVVFVDRFHQHLNHNDYATN